MPFAHKRPPAKAEVKETPKTTTTKKKKKKTKLVEFGTPEGTAMWDDAEL